MSGTSAEEVLDELNFGAANADRERELEEYFLETRVFATFVKDRTDLVVGAKGSGKSAIFRVLERGRYQVDDLAGADVLGAFAFAVNPRLTPLTANQEPAPHLVRHAWLQYAVAAFGNHVVEKYGNDTDVSDLSDWLEALDLRAPAEKKRKLRGFFERAFGDSAPIVIKADHLQERAPEEDFHEVLLEISKILERVGRRLWLIFDRLDEAFPDEPSQERAALRGLLQVAKDVNDYNAPFKIKLFMRNDVFEFVAGGDTRNQDRHQLTTITWDPRSLPPLLCKRLQRSPAFMSHFGFTPEDVDSPKGRAAMIHSLVPPQRPHDLHLSGEYGELATALEDTWLWLIRYLADGTSQYATPRNLLNYLDMAIAEQKEALDRGDVTVGGSLLSGLALKRAYVSLSQRRLQDTVRAEHSEVGQWTDRLHGAPRQLGGREALASELGLAPNSAAFGKALALLLSSGVLREVKTSEENKFIVAYLYREALGSRATARS